MVMPQVLFLLWIFYTSISLLRFFFFVSEEWHGNFEWNSIGSVEYLVIWSLSQHSFWLISKGGLSIWECSSEPPFSDYFQFPDFSQCATGMLNGCGFLYTLLHQLYLSDVIFWVSFCSIASPVDRDTLILFHICAFFIFFSCHVAVSWTSECFKWEWRVGSLILIELPQNLSSLSIVFAMNHI